MPDIASQITRLKQHPFVKVHRGASDTDINKLARTLNVKLPKNYSIFLRECGWAELNGMTIFGYGPDVRDRESVVAISDYEANYADPSIRHYHIPLMNDGAGNYDCLDTRKIKDGDCPVVFWDHEHPRGELQAAKQVSVSFTAWLKRKIDDLPAVDA